MSSSQLATIAVLSIGQMGLGIAKLLISQNYRVITNVSDRSSATKQRAESASIECLGTDEEIVKEADYILSILPPRDASATAQRIINATKSAGVSGKGSLYYLDMNAIAPSTARAIDELFKSEAPSIRFIDGGIIGGPPSPPSSSPAAEAASWTRPGIPISGPHPLSHAPVSGSHLAGVLNTRYLDAKIGSASGLKCTFAAMSKGFTALALQAYTTASGLGVLDDLKYYLDSYNPGARAKGERGIVGCPSKAYRWVEEMRQIGSCFEEEGGWAKEANVFRGIAGVYEGLAGVVEKRGGAQGMNDVGDVKGAVEILRRGLKEGIVTQEGLDKLLRE